MRKMIIETNMKKAQKEWKKPLITVLSINNETLMKDGTGGDTSSYASR